MRFDPPRIKFAKDVLALTIEIVKLLRLLISAGS